MKQGSLPNFKKFFEQSQSYITMADAAPPALEPWIQWFSLHTGLSYQQHKVFRLTDGPKSSHPDIWQIARQAGLTTFNCGSMNAKGHSSEGSLFLADPWCTTETCYPAELNTFHSFVVRQVQEHTNPLSRTRFASLAGLLIFLATHGLRGKTIFDIASQIVAERINGSALRWKRTVVLDWLQMDIFSHYWKQYLPTFSTFFLNSTAHFQHAYWRYYQPELFSTAVEPKEFEQYSNAIFFGYRNMDNLLADFFALEQKFGVTLVLASGLSQQPYLKFEGIGGQRFYRPRNLAKLLEDLGVQPKSVEPTMTHQFMITFESSADCDAAATALENVFCGSDPVFDFNRKSNNSLYFGCQLRKAIPDNSLIEFGTNRDKRAAFFDHFYLLDQTKSGCHHPEGILWLKTGTPAQHEDPVSILDAFPTLLELLGIDYTPSQQHPFGGRSLLPSSKRAMTSPVFPSLLSTARACSRASDSSPRPPISRPAN